MRQWILEGRVAALAGVILTLVLPVVGQDEAATPAPSVPELTAKLDRALEAGNLEGALYRYRILERATGQENKARLGQIGRMVLLRDLRAGRGWLAVQAAEVLALEGNEEALELLLSFAGGTEQAVNLRLGALKALAEVGGDSAARVARQVADDQERRMMERLTALDALLAMREFSAVQSLSLILRSAEQPYRIQALQSLRNRNAPATDLYRWATREEDAEIRLLALEGLAKLRDPEALRTLSEMLGDAKVVVRSVEVGGTKTAEDNEGPLYPEFQRNLRMARALLPQRDPNAMRFLTEAVLSPGVLFNQGILAAELAPVSPRGDEILREVLVQGSPTERLDAAVALADRGRVAEAVSAVIEIYRAAAGTQQEPVRVHAVEALGAMATPDALALLREAAQEDTLDLVRLRAARDLALAGDDLGLRLLRELLEAADRLLGQSVAVALVEIAAQAGAGS